MIIAFSVFTSFLPEISTRDVFYAFALLFDFLSPSWKYEMSGIQDSLELSVLSLKTHRIQVGGGSV